MRDLVRRVVVVGAVLGLPSCAFATKSPPVKEQAPVMMFVGDSFTVGSGPVPPWQTYASQTARLLGWQPIIAGAGGTGFCNEGRAGRTFQRSFEVELAWRPAPDLLVISGGHNDRRWSAERVRGAAASLLAEVRAHWPATRTVVVGPIWMGEPPKKAYGVRDAVAQAARAGKVTFLDPMRRTWPKEAILPDGVHPTLAGHEGLAAWLAAELA
ncbi:SGNH/GDSL hydrolase family protein [Nonomuraea gerenzanensis]|uniref:POSSIBLE EXPORTED PROTEIN n=1 Tax=Nonomuraea gerenzanensis TaxID=93944 RepID=A0A1M4DZ99_9ACTN|nr:SGNH/GDSL hydrolase family protein [Nonomuraea gerenzanensis]UBU14200.1 SGNH/GDSL hydrolase family protein [Nonomuraea gerenzanensis]SBO91893.1 POSSIBLE EXPORTED PROTEIN [Nonomuraea gerenzanensis]